MPDRAKLLVQQVSVAEAAERFFVYTQYHLYPRKGGYMKNRILLCMLFVIALAARCSAFELASPDFKDGGQLPVMSSCDGSGTAPGLVWSGAPAGAKSFALTCIDPDAPKGAFTHWIVYDIPATVTALAQGGKLPPGSRGLANDYGRQGFGQACPPSGTHRYIFTLYALRAEKLSADSRSGFFSAIKKAQISAATLTGLYKRK